MQQQSELEIEMQIWEYLDGLCSAADRERIEQLIALDNNWRLKYEEMVALNATIGSSLEEEQPAMRFTQNVMDAIDAEAIAPAARTYMNKWVIRGIAAFFMGVVGVFFTSVIGKLEGSESGDDLISGVVSGSIDLPTMPFDSIVYGFMFLNIIAGLLLIDGVLRSSRRQANEV